MSATREPILVTGGTGTLGTLVVRKLRQAGHPVRVLSRHAGEPQDGVEFVTGDLDSGDGVDAAVRGIGVIVHCAGASKGDGLKAENLGRAASAAGAGHLVNVSVVGADQVPVASRVDRTMFGYFESKLAAERAVETSGVPWTTLRATQFHDLMFTTAQGMAKLPVVPVPSGIRFQPVEVAEVAERLVELALGSPCGLAPDIAGPRAYPMADLVRGYVRARGKHRALLSVRLPGKAAHALRNGANLNLDRAVGRRTWEEFLAERAADAASPEAAAQLT